MTGMEHATEQAPIVKVAESFEGEGPVHDATILMMKTWGEQEPSHGVSQHPASYVATFVDMARALADAGLLAPAPLREEWSARYVNGGGAVCRTRHDADAELGRMVSDSNRHRIDEPPAPEIAGIYARYVSDWEPVHRAEGESWYDAEPDAMPDAGWEPIEPVDRAEGDGRDDADRAADAIQAVLDGRAEVRWCAAEEVPSEGDGRAEQ